jgi:hypothetical protein
MKMKIKDTYAKSELAYYLAHCMCDAGIEPDEFLDGQGRPCKSWPFFDLCAIETPLVDVDGNQTGEADYDLIQES